MEKTKISLVKNILGDLDIFFVPKGTNIKEYIYL